MKVTLVGAGPGDPGLLTISGSRALAEADVVIYDALANASLLKFAKPGAELIYVGKVADKHALPQEEINRLLAVKAREKGNVVRLKGGDPYIFGRGGEEGEYLFEHGIPFEEIPGISSAIAAPAYAGIPLTHRDFVSSLMIITGHEKKGKPDTRHNWKAFVESESTLVFVMGMANLAQICQNLLNAGMDPAMPAAVIYRGATPMQKSVISTVSNLPYAAKDLTNPAVIVVGRVVSLAGKLDWFSEKPLLGKTIAVTRSREQASEISEKLVGLGAAVIECPGIEISPLSDYSACDSALERLPEYSWLIFTSVNGVKYFWQRLAHSGRDSRSLGACKVAAIGPATAHSLISMGIRPDLVPATYVAEAVAEALIKTEAGKLAGKKILLPRAASARMVLPDALAQAGAIVDVVPVYETRPAKSDMAEVVSLLEAGKLDCVTFGSSSTVTNFLDLLPAGLLARHPEARLAVIGPITATTLEKHGLKAHIQPSHYTIPALVDAIVQNFSRGNE